MTAIPHNNNQDMLKRIEESLNLIRPYLQDDGGDVEIIEVTDDGVLKLKLLGACQNCRQSSMTMRVGIEEAVKHAVPEVKQVVAVNV